MTNIILSQQAYFCRDKKTCFVATKIVLVATPAMIYFCYERMYDYFLCYIVDDFQQVQPNGGQTETVFDKLVSRVSESHELTTCSSDQRVPKTADDVEFPDPVNPGGALDNTSSCGSC